MVLKPTGLPLKYYFGVKLPPLKNGGAGRTEYPLFTDGGRGRGRLRSPALYQQPGQLLVDLLFITLPCPRLSAVSQAGRGILSICGYLNEKVPRVGRLAAHLLIDHLAWVACLGFLA